MHILLIGYGKTSQKLAKQLFQQQQQISTISRSAKTDTFATHHIQDVHRLDLSTFEPIDAVYVLLSPNDSSVEAYQYTYLDSVAPIIRALKAHPVQRIMLVSSTRVYGENQGQEINDDSAIVANDRQGEILYAMEQAYRAAYPQELVVLRPSGIYGASVERLKNMAIRMQSYSNVHWSNRIHIDDLVACLAQMIHVEQPDHSYILTNNDPRPLHEILMWFQQQLNRPILKLESDKVTGKKLYATRLQKIGVKLKHSNCFRDYLALLKG